MKSLFRGEHPFFWRRMKYCSNPYRGGGRFANFMIPCNVSGFDRAIIERNWPYHSGRVDFNLHTRVGSRYNKKTKAFRHYNNIPKWPVW